MSAGLVSLGTSGADSFPGFRLFFLFFFAFRAAKKKNRSGGRVRVSFRDVRPPQWCNEVRIEAEEEEEESCRVSGG